jgi:peroxiredoxin
MTIPRLTTGDHAPSFELPDSTGSPVTFAPGDHAATVVVFTANGCPYARAWHDRIQAVAEDYKAKNVQVLLIVSNDETDHPEDSVEGMRRRVEAGDVASPFLRDADQAVAAAFGATATPEVFVVDQHGVVRYHGAPDARYDEPTENAGWVREALDSTLAGSEPARTTTSAAGCSIKWRVDLLWWQGCPSHEQAGELLRDILDDLGRGEVNIVNREVRTRGEAAELAFPGSPTFQVGGRDLFASEAPAALTCRVYERADGRIAPLPDREELSERLKDALARPWDLPGWTDFLTNN